MSGEGPALLGRNWLRSLKLDWKSICAVAREEPTTRLKALLSQYPDLFQEELGTITPFYATLQLKNDAQPKFCKARQVPFAIKEAIEKELDRLEACGILERVTYSEWAAPIVSVRKKDGKIRLCGDYKVTINPALEVDQYPLPRPDDLFATLTGGKMFTKLDLSQAYQQLRLDEDSTKYATVNTHRGLYRYTRMPFGIASAPAIFQKVMDTILQGVPNVICMVAEKGHPPPAIHHRPPRVGRSR